MAKAKPKRPAVRSEFTQALGARIRARRLAIDLTLEGASAASAGEITVTSWSNYEMGIQEPRVSKLLALCRALRCGLEWLIPPGHRPRREGGRATNGPVGQ